MIEINLLSEEAKVKTKGLGRISLDSKYFLYFIPLVFSVLILAHICLALVGIFKASQFRTLNNKWQALAPQRETLKNFKKEYDITTSDARIIEELNNRRLNWSEKLNRLSLNLVSGIWFNEATVSWKELILKASVVSLQKEEMNLINRFIDRLKNDIRFFEDFNSVELGSVQRKSIGGYDVIDFVLTAKIKPR